MKNNIALLIFALAFIIIASVVFAQTKGPGFSKTSTQQGNWYAKSYELANGSQKLTNDDMPFPSKSGTTDAPQYTHSIEKISGQYQVTSCGGIVDTKTNLEWYTGPDKATDWKQAQSWVSDLSACGVDWRMPKSDKLKKLYQKGVGTRNMDPVFKTTGWFVWSEKPKNPAQGVTINFHDGSESSPESTVQSNDNRVFAVRKHK